MLVHTQSPEIDQSHHLIVPIPVASAPGKLISALILYVLLSLQILGWRFACGVYRLIEQRKVIDFQFVQHFLILRRWMMTYKLFILEMKPEVYIFYRSYFSWTSWMLYWDEWFSLMWLYIFIFIQKVAETIFHIHV